MSSNLIGLVVSALGAIVFVGVAVGLPALAVVCMRYFKMKERELELEMEFRERSQRQDLALEERVQRLEDALGALDHDVRAKLGIGESIAPSSPADLMEAPATPEGQRERSLAR